MLESGTEIITLENDTVYSPTFISTDKRIPLNGRTSLGYWRIGETQQYGASRGPVFKVEFIDFSEISGSVTHVKIWGIDNDDDNLAPIYPLTYLADHPVIHVYLQKFLFCDSSGNAVDPEEAYTVVGYKKRVLPLAW